MLIYYYTYSGRQQNWSLFRKIIFFFVNCLICGKRSQEPFFVKQTCFWYSISNAFLKKMMIKLKTLPHKNPPPPFILLNIMDKTIIVLKYKSGLRFYYWIRSDYGMYISYTHRYNGSCIVFISTDRSLCIFRIYNTVELV